MTGYRFPRYVSLACPCAKCVGPKLRVQTLGYGWGKAYDILYRSVCRRCRNLVQFTIQSFQRTKQQCHKRTGNETRKMISMPSFPNWVPFPIEHSCKLAATDATGPI